MEKNAYLQKSRLFSGLSPAELKKLAAILRIKNLRKGELLFLEGDPADGFYLLCAGRVKIHKISVDGREQILHQIVPGQIFAEAAIFHGDHYPADCTAIEDSVVALLPKKAFLELVERDPQISLKIIGSLSAFLREFTEIIENLSLKEVPARIAGFLARRSAAAGQTTIVLEMTKTELARHLGTSSETFSRALRRLSDANIIKVQGRKIIILDPKRLAQVAAGEKI